MLLSPDAPQGQGTFGGAELHGLGHGPHPLGVAGLDLEEVGGVQGELLDLVREPVAHHGLDDPVVDLGVDVRAVVDDVPWAGKGDSSSHTGTASHSTPWKTFGLPGKPPGPSRAGSDFGKH